MDIYENVLLIKSDSGFSCKIAGADIHDFPGFPEFDSLSTFSLSSHTLKDLIVKSSFAAAKDESRAVLCGVFFEITPFNYSIFPRFYLLVVVCFYL